MNTKLTLTIEKSVIEKAKKYARKKDKSLSDIVENYLKAVTKDIPEDTENEITPTVSKWRGAFKSDVDFDAKEDLTHRLSEKYLK